MWMDMHERETRIKIPIGGGRKVARYRGGRHHFPYLRERGGGCAL